MKRTGLYLLSLYFLLGSMFPMSDFSQLTTMSSLYQHYLKHKKEALAKSGDLDMIDFLRIHFFTLDNHQSQDSDHANLPFQSVNSSIVMIQILEKGVSRISSGESSATPFYYDAPVTSEFSQNIFQPPVLS